MSLINQVLSDLEKRGVKAQPGGIAVRPVNAQEQRRKIIIPALIALLLLSGVAGLWAGLRHKPAPTPIAATPGIPHENIGQPPVKQNSAAQDVSRHDALSPDPGRKHQADDKHVEMHMSLESSTTPLPSSLRSKQALRMTPGHMHAQSQVDKKPTVPLIGNAGKQVSDASTATSLAKSPAYGGRSVIPPESTTAGIDKKVRQDTVQQQAENEFRKANGLMQQGRIDEAIAGYKSALQLDAGHDAARQAMVGLLLESKRNDDAEQVLKDGLGINPKHSGFAMLLARLQVERNALQQALDTLQKTLPYAEQQADYQAFIAAVLQRVDRHKDAIEHYQIALQLAPNSGVWLMGLGISLQAEKRNEAARAAFRQAADSHTLNRDLQVFVTQRLRELNP